MRFASLTSRFLLLPIAALLAAAPFAAAVDSLKANVNELAPRARRAAPEWIEVTLRSNSTGIREGSLEFTLLEWGREIYRYRTHELAVNTGDQHFRFLLPAASASGTNAERALHLEFFEKNRATPILLGLFPLVASQHDARAQVIAVVRPNYRGGGEVRPLWQVLRLERLAPEQGPLFDTTPTFFDPAELPSDPLGFCPFDLVLVEPDGLRTMREKARKALAQWVAAGGSLCVIAESGVDPEHVDWLNQLAAPDPQWKPLTLDEARHATLPAKMNFARANFGRLVVAATAPKDDADMNSLEWRSACAFLWKMRSAQATAVMHTGKWNPLVNAPMARAQSYAGRIAPATFPFADSTTVFVALMPRLVRVVPMSAVFVVIGLFVVMIGPGDWFILGLLRRRRWTWVFFPLVTLIATGTTVWLGRHYMGTSSNQSALIITDLGTDGRAVRETRLEFELHAGQHLAQWPTNGAIRLPMGIGNQSYLEVYSDSSPGDIRFEGQFPGHYQFSRPMEQWKPALTRATSIGDGADTSGIRWEAYDRAKFANVRLDIVPSMNPQKDCHFVFFHSGSEFETHDKSFDSGWLQRVTVTFTNGLGLLLSQVSPNGFSRLEDLSCLELDDTTRTVIVATKREGGNIHVWRRLYLY